MATGPYTTVVAKRAPDDHTPGTARLRRSEARLRVQVGDLERRAEKRAAELADANASLQNELRERAAAEERIKGLFKRLLTVQEDERRRIAREIHDQIGQQITALRMALDTIEIHTNREAALAHAERASRLARELDESLDFLTWDLRPPALDHLGLAAALANLSSGWAERFGIAVDYHAVGMDGHRLAPHVEINLYRIVQEALHNVHRHAGPCTVSIVLERADGELILTIEDDGRGFDTEADDRQQQMGLASMRERTALTGGRIDVESAPGRGTAIYVRVPLDGGAGGGISAGTASGS